MPAAPEKIDFEEEWKPTSESVYAHEEYNVKTMAVYVDGERAGYLDFVFTIDPEEEMSIQFWETAIHPKFQSAGLFTTMLKKLKQIAMENNVKRLYVSIENDNLPALIANYMLGGKILYAKDAYKGEKARFGIPRRNDLIFIYELKKE
jgi:GNAT superfamily N-acetyltransferase